LSKQLGGACSDSTRRQQAVPINRDPSPRRPYRLRYGARGWLP
jgi:hypothetical protein